MVFRCRWLAVGLALLSITVGGVGGARPQVDETIRVMSFNIRYGTARDGDNVWELRRDAVIEVIEGFGPHVLGLQEALRFQLDELAAAMPRYVEVGVGRADGDEAGEYAAILIDAVRIEVLARGTFWFSDTPEQPGSTSWGNDIPRICTWAHLQDHNTGRSFHVYNVHWDHRSQPSRERSAELLLRRIAERVPGGGPVIVTGDFNAGESNPAFQFLLDDDAVSLSDTFRVAHPDATGVGTFNGFEGATDGDKIDAVLASADWRVVAAEIVRSAPSGRYPSDHFPVTATLGFRPPIPVAGSGGFAAGFGTVPAGMDP